MGKKNNFINNQIKIIRKSGLFDEKYYLNKNIDVANANIDPVQHYCNFGWKENRNPSELFNTKFYLENNVDVYNARINPLYHYILFGEKEGRLPCEKKDTLSYKKNMMILFVGHEASQTGAPILLLDIINWFKNFTAYKVKVILLKGGQIEKEYKKNVETLILQQPNDINISRKQVTEFIGDENCIIFLNTVVAARFAEIIDLKKYPHIAFIHELEKTLSGVPKELNLLKENVRSIIAASDAVTKNLINNHGYSKNEVETVFAFIDPQHQYLDDEKRRKRRQEINLSLEKTIMYGCGNLHWRKNPKCFIEVAEKVLAKTDKKCEFIWIGNGEEKEACEKLVKEKNLQNHIKFIGSVDNPSDYFAAGDIFLLPSIEDPFPLVCLEAADCGLPIVCFDEAGGMPIFVENDAGFVVPFNDHNLMAEATCKLIEDKGLRQRLGKTARDKLLKRHVINKSAQQIKKIINNKLKPKIALFQHGLNFGKGGAEKVLIEMANQLFDQGYCISVYNRTHSCAPLPFRLNPNIPLYTLGVNEDLKNLLIGNKPDICIVNSIGHPDSKNIEQLHASNIPVILSMHNQPNFFDKVPGKEEHLFSLQIADCVVTLVPLFKEEYLKRGIKTPIKVIPNFVIKPQVEEKFRGFPNRKFIFTAGRLVEQKQQDILIAAFAKIFSEFPDWDLIIAGEGHLRSNLQQQIINCGLVDRVRLIGEVDNIGDYYKNCDLFVLPSKFEGFGLVIYEAASFGKPVIVFKDCPPYGEMFNDNDSVELVNEITSDALSKSMHNYMMNNTQNIAEKMYKFYKQYSPDLIIPMWERLINNLFNKSL